MKKIKCPSCNKEILDNVRACPYCGFDEISSYLLYLEKEKQSKYIDYTSFHNNVPIQPQIQPQKDIIHCPKCNSTAITTGARGVNNFWGFIGASKTVNRCGNCGYTWKPNGR